MVVDTTYPKIGGQGRDRPSEPPPRPTFPSPTTSDTCNTSSIVLDSDTTAAGCGNTCSETRTWHAVGACNNTSGTVTQTIMVVDDQAPSIGGQGSDGTVECPASPTFTSPTTSDTCNTSSIVLDSDTTAAGCGNPYSETRTWHAVDACGNTSSQVHQTIMVVDDQA